MSYAAASHAKNIRQIAALLDRGTRPSVIAARTDQPAARVEHIRQVLELARRGLATSAIAAAAGLSAATVVRIRAALGVAASKADGGRAAARRRVPVTSAVTTRCRTCGQLVGGAAAHGPAECAAFAARR